MSVDVLAQDGAIGNAVTNIGTLNSSDRGDPEINAEFEVLALTGVGAEKAPH